MRVGPRTPALVVVLVVLALALESSCSHVNVYVTENAPFVRRVVARTGEEVLSGHDVMLWERAYDILRASDSNLTYSFVSVGSRNEIFERVRVDPLGLGLSGLPVTASVVAEFKTSPAYFQTGADLVYERVPPGSSLLLIFSPLDWRIWISGAALMYFSGHVFWFFERNVQPRRFPRAYLAGVNQGVWYAWGTLTFSKTFDIKGFSTRMYSVGWSSLCIIYIAAYTANLMSILLQQQLKSQVESIADLNKPGIKIGVVQGTPGQLWAQQYMVADVVEFATLDAAWEAVETAKVVGMFYDGAVLQFLLNTRSFNQRLSMLGQRVTAEVYGIVYHKDFELSSKIDAVVLEMNENNFLTYLRDQWFERKFVPTQKFTQQQLNLQSFAGMYIVLAFSFVTAIVTFCVVRLKHFC